MEGEKMKRSLSIAFLGALFTSVIAGALILSTLRLLQSKSALTTTTAGAPQKVVSESLAASPSPTIVGTDHPVLATSPQQLADIPKYKAPNPPATPYKAPNPPAPSTPQPSAVAETDSQNQAETQSELVREKAEHAREKAEQLRARIEDLYQAHRISVAAYKQGQAEYQHELANYENQIAKLRSASTGTGAANE
jgi:hypothetical protein